MAHFAAGLKQSASTGALSGSDLQKQGHHQTSVDGPTAEQQQARLRSLKAVVLALQKENAVTHAWRLHRTQEDQEARLQEEESALVRYQENAQLMKRLFEPSEAELEKGCWEGLGREEALDVPGGVVDRERAGADSGAARDLASDKVARSADPALATFWSGEAGQLDGEKVNGARESAGSGAALADMRRVVRYLHPENRTGVFPREGVLRELQGMARSIDGDVGANDGLLPVSPRKLKRKVEPQAETKGGPIDGFAQLLVGVGNVSSNIDVRECEAAYARVLKKRCRLPSFPEGGDRSLQYCWPSLGKQWCRTRLDRIDDDHVRTMGEGVSSCQL